MALVLEAVDVRLFTLTNTSAAHFDSSHYEITLMLRCMINYSLFYAGNAPKSKDTIPKSLDRSMDKANPSGDHAEPGISIRHGPVEEMEVDPPAVAPKTNGAVNGKRKGRQSISKNYKEASSDSEDNKPLVRHLGFAHTNNRQHP